MGDTNYDGRQDLAMGAPGSDSFNQERLDAGEVIILRAGVYHVLVRAGTESLRSKLVKI